VLLHLIAWCYIAGLVHDEPSVDTVEFFAGEGAVTGAFRFLGYRSYPFEVKHDHVVEDLNSRSGFAFALSLVLNCKPGGCIWMGVVCSTWVFMFRASTGQGENRVLGNPTRCVLAGNRMVSRATLLVYLAHALGCLAVIEQPSSSILRLHPRLQMLLSLVDMYSCSFFLGYYMADSAKPITLLTNRPWFDRALQTRRSRSWFPRSTNVSTRSTDEYGVVRVTGDSGLKNTQTYPVAFGFAVASSHHEHSHLLLATAELSLMSNSGIVDLEWLWEPADDLWMDACLLRVFGLLKEMAVARGVSV
jgi:hypothetical protein